jgi:transcriptional regulator with XRE-family HTH domain
MEKKFRRMRDPAARRAYVEAEVASGLAHQIRVLRTQRGWTQRDLAEKLGTTQAAVSRLEDPSYGRPSIKTLLDVGAAFDIALQVRFVSFVRLLQETRSISREQLEVESFEIEAEKVGFHGEAAERGYLTFDIDASSARFVAGAGALLPADRTVEFIARDTAGVLG